MYYRILTVSPGLSVEVTGEGAGARCELSLGEGGERWEVPLEVVALLWLADGERTVEVLHELALEAGATLSLERIEAWLRDLHEAKLVALSPLAGVSHWLLPQTEAHGCEGCGRSCEGHLVGPLPPSEVQGIQEVLPRLQALEPTLEGLTPFMSVSRKPGVYLRLIRGRCIFLDEERRCCIHKHLGEALKPSICRMFPYMRVLTDDGYRLAIAPGCFRHHKQSHAGEGEAVRALDAGERLGAASVSLLRLSAHGLAALVGGGAHEGGEAVAQTGGALSDDQLVLRLGVSGVRLQDLLDWLGHDPAQRIAFGDTLQRHTFSVEAVRWCMTACARLIPRLSGERSFIGNIARESGPFAQRLQALMRVMSGEVRPMSVALPRQTEGFLLDALRRSLFLRDALSFSDTSCAVAALLVGWVIALAGGYTAADTADTADTADSAEQPPNVEAIHDLACELWAAWYRVISHSGLGAQLFTTTQEAPTLFTLLRSAHLTTLAP
jgi:Fe-S-cluster containining protein